MYVSELRLRNFRKFGTKGNTSMIDETKSPDLVVKFNKWLNLLLGENDSGKTAIIDALKIILKTHSAERIKIDKEDFTEWTNNLRIECLIKSKFSDEDTTASRARWFTEWLSFDESNNPELRLILNVRKMNDRIEPYEVKAGADFYWYQLSAEAKDRLKCTYLKPLRDAETELLAKKWSRLSQILEWHPLFINKESHQFLTRFKKLNKFLKWYFWDSRRWKEITDTIVQYLEQFYGSSINVPFSVNDPNLKNILELLKLAYEDIKKWLGNQNLLFIATELLHLKRDDNECLKLWLIEEIEAHLHPQSQMRVVETLQTETESWVQLIISTHSPNIASKIKLENITLCSQKGVFNLSSNNTKLEPTDYTFLERFLDVTKANLFFARWILLVEWWWEEILLPVLAKKLWYDLTQRGVSVVNVWNIAHLRYARIFWRQIEWENIWIRVAIVVDLDIKPADIETKKTIEIQNKQSKFEWISEDIKLFISPEWTLEYCIARSSLLKPLLLQAMINTQKEEYLYKIESWERQTASAILNSIQISDLQSFSEEEIYKQIASGTKIWNLYAEKISKSILAQQLASLLEEKDNVFFEELKQEMETDADNKGIKYLFDAIKHACGD